MDSIRTTYEGRLVIEFVLVNLSLVDWYVHLSVWTRASVWMNGQTLVLQTPKSVKFSSSTLVLDKQISA